MPHRQRLQRRSFGWSAVGVLLLALHTPNPSTKANPMDNEPSSPANPADAPYEAELDEAGALRPLEQVPSAWTIKGDPKVTSLPTLESFSPAERDAIVERAGGNDPTAIQAAIHSHLLDKSRSFRIAGGIGDGATETERTALGQIDDLRLLSTEYGKLTDALADVVDYQVGRDADGNPIPDAIPIYRVTGDRRTAMEARLPQLDQQMLALAGVEGEKALEEARLADAMRLRTIREAIADQHEITRRAHELAREDRLNQAARTRSKFLGGNSADLPDYR